MIDTGVNLVHSSFASDLEAVIDAAEASGVEQMIVTGTSVAISRQALALTTQYPGRLACTAGVHPHHADETGASPAWVDALRQLAGKTEVCALGETGLDYHRNYSARKAQRRAFGLQLELAEELRKPVFVHERDTGGEVADMLVAHSARLAGAVVHCFTGSREDLTRYLDAGCLIGITGWVCDERRGQRLQALAGEIPDDRLMIETDAPYLTPRNMPRPYPHRNVPANLVWVLKKLAELRRQDETTLARITADNARRFFSLGPGAAQTPC